MDNLQYISKNSKLFFAFRNLNEKSEEFIAKYEKLNSLNQSFSGEISRQQSLLSEMKDKLEKLETDNTKLSEDVINLQKTILDKDDLVVNLNVRSEALQARTEVLEKENIRLTEEALNFRRIILEKDDNSQNLAAKVEVVTNQLQILEKEREEITELKNFAETELETLKTLLVDKEMQIDNYSKSTIELEETNKELQKVSDSEREALVILEKERIEERNIADEDIKALKECAEKMKTEYEQLINQRDEEKRLLSEERRELDEKTGILNSENNELKEQIGYLNNIIEENAKSKMYREEKVIPIENEDQGEHTIDRKYVKEKIDYLLEKIGSIVG